MRVIVLIDYGYVGGAPQMAISSLFGSTTAGLDVTFVSYLECATRTSTSESTKQFNFDSGIWKTV